MINFILSSDFEIFFYFGSLSFAVILGGKGVNYEDFPRACQAKFK